ncbi:glycosyltransferase [Candidatus Dojkabacteria bacterium]|nr:glycosyltransferase [Candidatus Dojkabacteria bacterium]
MNSIRKTKKMKQLSILGSVWDHAPSVKLFDIYFESRFISFYNPWLKGYIDKEKIYCCNEKKTYFWLFPWKAITRTIVIMRSILSWRPDVIVTHHDEGILSCIPVLLFYRLFLKKKVKFVGFVRRGAQEYFSDSLRTAILRKIIPLVYPVFDVILTPSIGNCKQLQKFFNLRNVHHLYNPVDIEKYLVQSEKRVMDVIQKDTFRFIAIGRLVQQKAYDRLINAFSLVVKQYPAAKLVILGEGELQDDIQKHISALGLGDSIQLLGHIKNVFPYIRMADCMILASYWESFGNVIVEALALNKLVISCDCQSGPREILAPELGVDEAIKYPYFGKFGILTSPFSLRKYCVSGDEPDVEEKNLANIMVKIVGNKGIRKRYCKVNKAVERFNFHIVASQLNKVLGVK